MQGPTAVTVETLTLAHFLDRTDRFAACVNDIKALDAQVTSLHTWQPCVHAMLSALVSCLVQSSPTQRQALRLSAVRETLRKCTSNGQAIA